MHPSLQGSLVVVSGPGGGVRPWWWCQALVVVLRPVAVARPVWQPGGVIRVHCGRRVFPTNTQSAGHILVTG